MPVEKADVCDRCGKIKVKEYHSDSSGMVIFQGPPGSLLLLRDLRPGELARPMFPLHDKVYCPRCLVKDIQDWVRTAVEPSPDGGGGPD